MRNETSCKTRKILLSKKKFLFRIKKISRGGKRDKKKNIK